MHWGLNPSWSSTPTNRRRSFCQWWSHMMISTPTVNMIRRYVYIHLYPIDKLSSTDWNFQPWAADVPYLYSSFLCRFMFIYALYAFFLCMNTSFITFLHPMLFAYNHLQYSVSVRRGLVIAWPKNLFVVYVHLYASLLQIMLIMHALWFQLIRVICVRVWPCCNGKV